jgi:hypothetical protein
MAFNFIDDLFDPIQSRFNAWERRTFSGSNVVKGGRSYLKSAVHAEGMDWVKWNFGIQKNAKGVGRLLGPAITAYSAYQGYKQGGVAGAVVEGGKTVAESYVFGAVMKAIGGFGTIASGAAFGLGVMGAASAATTGGNPIMAWSRPWVRQHTRNLNRLELGVPITDQFGTIATSRQRAIQAIQSSRINGRSALGNEAALMYQPYFR